MQTLNYFFSLKIIKFCLPILLTITCIGLFNGSWYSLILWSTLLLLFFSAILTKNKNRVFGAIFISVLSFSFQNLIELPEIIEAVMYLLEEKNIKIVFLAKNFLL